LDAIALTEIGSFIQKFISYVKSVYGDLYAKIDAAKDISPDVIEELKPIAQEFAKLFEVEKQ